MGGSLVAGILTQGAVSEEVIRVEFKTGYGLATARSRSSFPPQSPEPANPTQKTPASASSLDYSATDFLLF
jgi:hypothetical protein